MSLKDVVLYPDKRLRQKCEYVEKITPEITQLIEDLKATMEAERGLGIAAPQLGTAKCVIVTREPETAQPIVIINPEIVAQSGTVRFAEACLSLPGIEAQVTRALSVTVRGMSELWQPIKLELTHIFAACAQHEIDHLSGILFIDRVSPLRRDLLKNKLKLLSR